MRTTVIRPIQTSAGLKLDMRTSPKLGTELRDEIIKCVEHTQKWLQTELPNWLILDHEQFVSLLDYTEEMYQTTDRMFRTPLNVMEVEVDEDLHPVQPEDVGLSSEDVIDVE